MNTSYLVVCYLTARRQRAQRKDNECVAEIVDNWITLHRDQFMNDLCSVYVCDGRVAEIVGHLTSRTGISL